MMQAEIAVLRFGLGAWPFAERLVHFGAATKAPIDVSDKPKREFGINENLAREILELHTLGVNGGYTQTDVTAFAQIITGWSIGGGRGRLAGGTPGCFYFRENLHEPGAKTFLGKTYRESGQRQGEAVLADLAVHPATARFIEAGWALKPCRPIGSVMRAAAADRTRPSTAVTGR